MSPDRGETAARPERRGGEVNAAITSALVGIHNQHLGRGPAHATTFHRDNIIVTVLYGVLTRAEKLVADAGSEDAVVQMRHLFQHAVEPEFVRAVERETGAKVVTFVSGNSTEPDVATEVFILDRPVGGSPPG
jgi:uncharacterized protein YbcI